MIKKSYYKCCFNSYTLKQGGSGILIAEINDENLKDYYVSFNEQRDFEMFPFHKKIFISIITWPIDINEFKGVNILLQKIVLEISQAWEFLFIFKSFKPKLII